jgi:ubiquinone/menaquinone biosynthesis C-methylase UbiE
MNTPNNLDKKTVEGFGDEWSRFDQTGMSDEDTQRIFESYFAVFPWAKLPKDAVGFDLGCGSGRWAKLVAQRLVSGGKLHCIDPSIAIEVARRNLRGMSNCEFHQSGVDHIPLPDHSMDFGYSLGVLHHIPDTQQRLPPVSRSSSRVRLFFCICTTSLITVRYGLDSYG